MQSRQLHLLALLVLVSGAESVRADTGDREAILAVTDDLFAAVASGNKRIGQ